VHADPAIVDVLRELSRRLRAIAVISGRDSDDLAARLPIAGLLLFGNHGMEEPVGDHTVVTAEAQPYLPSLSRAAEAIAGLPEAHDDGIAVERKRVSIAVHYRKALSKSEAARRLEAVLRPLAQRAGLRLYPGRMVWELRPPVEVDKGEVLERLRRQLDPAGILYIGDDLTDAAAFRALHRMDSLPGLAVGVHSLEAPDGSFADTDLLVDGVPGVRRLLAALRDQAMAWTPR
jgi:trehalose 6-phosphate phosphatase